MRQKSSGFLVVLSLFVVVLTGGVTPTRGQAGPMAPRDLHCEYLENPVGIDVRQPRFSWLLAHSSFWVDRRLRLIPETDEEDACHEGESVDSKVDALLFIFSNQISCQSSKQG